MWHVGGLMIMLQELHEDKNFKYCLECNKKTSTIQEFCKVCYPEGYKSWKKHNPIIRNRRYGL